MMDRKLAVGALLCAALVIAVGCGSSAPPAEPDPMADAPPVVKEPPPPPPAPPRDQTPKYEDPNERYANVLVPIHFEFNKYRILPEAKPILEGIAQLLKGNPRWRVLVEGHCDERGTAEYNLGLGEQRALSAKRYLVSLGVSESRFQTISYGEERPVDRRSNEEAWAKNRRAEFRVEAPGA